ncbi:hypothetical protein HG531_003335 [Fusarium graminearum]|nr:hypothetical protein HG531_003335 [Fusarium graminearum]
MSISSPVFTEQNVSDTNPDLRQLPKRWQMLDSKDNRGLVALFIAHRDISSLALALLCRSRALFSVGLVLLLIFGLMSLALLDHLLGCVHHLGNFLCSWGLASCRKRKFDLSDCALGLNTSIICNNILFDVNLDLGVLFSGLQNDGGLKLGGLQHNIFALSFLDLGPKLRDAVEAGLLCDSFDSLGLGTGATLSR